MYYNLNDDYDISRHRLHDCIENALNTSIAGVLDIGVTYGNTVGGYFMDSADKLYLFETDGISVLFAPDDDNIRIDAGRGKKCPGGYWIPRNKDCRSATMSPSARRGVGLAKSGLAKAAVGAALAAGVGYAAKKAVDNNKAQATSQRNRRMAMAAGGGLGAAGAAAAGYTALKKRGGKKESDEQKWDKEFKGKQGNAKVSSKPATPQASTTQSNPPTPSGMSEADWDKAFNERHRGTGESKPSRPPNKKVRGTTADPWDDNTAEEYEGSQKLNWSTKKGTTRKVHFSKRLRATRSANNGKPVSAFVEPRSKTNMKGRKGKFKSSKRITAGQSSAPEIQEETNSKRGKVYKFNKGHRLGSYYEKSGGGVGIGSRRTMGGRRKATFKDAGETLRRMRGGR